MMMPPGFHSMLITDTNIEAVKKIVVQNRRIIIREFGGEVLDIKRVRMKAVK